MDVWTILLRFFLVFLFAFIFGFERQRSHKPIGFGTFIFVAIGSCALAITATTIGQGNPLPLLSAIVTGIGFLGAGALIKTTDKIFGFTTAASIWLFAIFGLLIGSGEYLPGGLTYLSVWLVILVDNHLEKKGMGTYQKKIIIRSGKLINIHEIDELLLLYSKKYKMIKMEIDKKNNKCSIEYLVEGTKETINKIPKKLFEKDWFESFTAE